MEIGNGMPHQDLDEAPGSFHDFAAHFSKAEWKLLHKWQRDLYEIMMKEIQQALTSLAPRISNSIFSLRPKEKEDLFRMDHQDSEIKNKTDCSLRPAPPIPPFSDDDDESEAHSMQNQDSEGGQGSGRFTERAVNTSVVPFRIKEEKASCFDDYLISETQESIDSPTEHDSLAQIVSFVIKEDGTSDSMDHQDSDSRESSNTPAGVQQLSSEVEDRPVASNNCIQLRHPSLVFPHVISDGIMARLVIMRPGHEIITVHKKEDEETRTMDKRVKMESVGSCSTFAYVEPEERTYFHEVTKHRGKTGGKESRSRKIIPGSSVADTKIIGEGNVLHETTQGKFHRSIVERTRSRSHLWLRGNRDLAGGKTSHCQNVSMHPKHSIFQRSTSSVQGSNKCNAFESNLWHENLLTHQPNAQIGFRPYACLHCGKFFKTRNELTRHHRTHSGERPYHCMVCGHNFSQRHHLIRHQRTHTGERPYQCMECKKRFSFKQNLNRHQRTHLVTFQTTPLKNIITARNPT